MVVTPNRALNERFYFSDLLGEMGALIIHAYALISNKIFRRQ